MKNKRVFRSIFLLAAIILLMAAGSRMLPGFAVVNAGEGLVKYKVVSTGSANTVYEYEKILNDMAFQGWVFDHAVVANDWVVFRK